MIIKLGTADKQFVLYDLRKPNEVLKKYDSLLKSQTRAVSLLTDLKGIFNIKKRILLCKVFLILKKSVEGRVAVNFFTEGKIKQDKSFPFKCHR
jgi:hypothetical protein